MRFKCSKVTLLTAEFATYTSTYCPVFKVIMAAFDVLVAFPPEAVIVSDSEYSTGLPLM